jgi:nucleotidyltransferase/DNA polymerase involved in DNA repair
MPVSSAYRLCPDAIFIPGNFSDYVEASEEFMEVLEEYADGRRVRRASIDEAYIEVTERVAEQPGSYALARNVQKRVKDETQLPCSIGIASNMSVAKVATSQNKPMGITVVPQGSEKAAEFLAPLEVEQLHGVGKKTGERLRAHGIEYLWQIQKMTLAELWPIMGKSSVWLRNRALGIDDRPLPDSGPRTRKSISKKRTFMEDVDPDARNFLIDAIQSICDRIGEKLTSKGYSYKTVGLTLRYDDFDTIQRSKSLRVSTDDRDMLRNLAVRLLDDHLDPRRMLRQIGVTVSNLLKDEKQCTLMQFL